MVAGLLDKGVEKRETKRERESESECIFRLCEGEVDLRGMGGVEPQRREREMTKIGGWS